MYSSLASPVCNLNSLPLTNILRQQYPNPTSHGIKHKGIFPNCYLNTIEKLHGPSLTPLEAFKIILLAKSAVRRTTDLLKNLGRSSTAKYLVTI